MLAFPGKTLCAAALAALLATVANADDAARRPNVVILFADDLGYADGGFGGNPKVPTPNLDALAAAGVRCNSGYVTAPVCSPSRAGLLTGRYQHRFGFEFNAGPMQRAVSQDMGLPLDQTTIADLMRKNGYATGMVGKWHQGLWEKYNPTNRGFDEYFGFLFGANLYILPDADGAVSEQVGDETFSRQRPKSDPIVRGTEPVDEREYLTDAFSREAVSFIDRHKDQPFFLYVPFNAVHTPFQTTDEYYERFPTIENRPARVFAAMLSALDDAVGEILGKLRDSGLENDTLVFFLSDNGGPLYTGVQSNGPLNGGKLTLFEGGVRVPYFVKWPGHLPAGETYDKPVSTMDILPTAVAAGGGTPPTNIDGVDLLPYLTGENTAAPHDILFWRNGHNAAVRKGDWKLWRVRDTAGQARATWLYNLAADLGETTDVSKENPEVVKELLGELEKWEADMAAPLWPARMTKPTKVNDLEMELAI